MKEVGCVVVSRQIRSELLFVCEKNPLDFKDFFGNSNTVVAEADDLLSKYFHILRGESIFLKSGLKVKQPGYSEDFMGFLSLGNLSYILNRFTD